jgi:hypothetical protein
MGMEKHLFIDDFPIHTAFSLWISQLAMFDYRFPKGMIAGKITICDRYIIMFIIYKWAISHGKILYK